MKLIVRWQFWILLGLVMLGCSLRLYGLNWDAGNSFHPDERQILFHVTALGWPKSWAEFLNPAQSPLNPQFFAYGSFPIYFLAAIGRLLGYDLHDPKNFFTLTLVGRVVSAIFDSGTILATACLAGVLARKTKQLQSQAWYVALLAATLLAFTPLHLQLSHFYAVDTLLAFFVVLTILFCVLWVDSPRPFLWAILAGVAYGLAMATKFSAAPLVLSLLSAAWLRWQRCRNFLDLAVALLGSAIFMVTIFFITQPYALLDMPSFIQQVSDQSNLVRGSLDLPYVRQFVGTLPFIYQGKNLLIWGMGITAGCSALAGCGWLLWFLRRNLQSSWLIVLVWVLAYSIIVGSFYVKFMRYLLPVYPFFIVIASAFLMVMLQHIRWEDRRYSERLVWLKPCLQATVLLVVLGGTIFQGLALLNVYSEPNTRVQASNWIYQHVAPDSMLTYEQWDDALPVPVGKHNPAEYKQATYIDANGQPTTGLDLYDDDTQAKAQQLATLLPTIDVITMPTDRLDKSIPRSPKRYPLTIRYYQLLFSGQLGFHLAAQFENHPHLFGITLDDSDADESYSVFDHPTARIFVRDPHYPYTSQQLLAKLTSGLNIPAK